MAKTSLSLDELVRKLMGDDHADVLRETLAWFVGELMEAEVTWPDRRRPAREGARAHDAQERLPRAHLADARRRDRARHPAAAVRQLLPELPRAAQPLGEGARGRHPGGLRQRRQYAQGRPARDPARPRRHEQERREPPLLGARRAGALLPRAPPGGRLPLPLAGRQGGARQRARRGASQGPRGRLRRARDGAPRGHRHRRRRGRDRGLLEGVPEKPASPRPLWREALRLRRSRGPQGRHRQGARLPLAALHGALPQGHARPLRQGAAADRSPPPSARSSPPRAPRRPANGSPAWRRHWSAARPRWRVCWPQPRRSCSPS